MPSILPVYKSIKTLKFAYYSNSILGYGFSTLNLKEGINLLLSLEQMEENLRYRRKIFFSKTTSAARNKKNKNLKQSS
jgi:hypothetical protein